MLSDSLQEVPDVAGGDLSAEAQSAIAARRAAREERLGEIAYEFEISRFSGQVVLAAAQQEDKLEAIPKFYARNLMIDRK